MLILLAALSGCVPASAPPPAPAPVGPASPTPQAPPPSSADWRDWPMTPGNWSYAQDAQGPVASFGRPGVAPDFAIRCDRANRRITLSRSGDAGTAGQMKVRTSFGEAVWPARTSAGTPSYASVDIDAMDPALDRMSFSRGRFIVEVGKLPYLAMPPWAELTRVVEDCRG